MNAGNWTQVLCKSGTYSQLLSLRSSHLCTSILLRISTLLSKNSRQGAHCSLLCHALTTPHPIVTLLHSYFESVLWTEDDQDTRQQVPSPDCIIWNSTWRSYHLCIKNVHLILTVWIRDPNKLPKRLVFNLMKTRKDTLLIFFKLKPLKTKNF